MDRREVLLGTAGALLMNPARAQRGDRPTLSPHITLINAYESRVDLPAPAPPDPIPVGRAKQLLADDWVIERREGLERTFHPVKKHPANPLLTPREPWETPSVLLSGSVILDPAREADRFRMWYLCYTPSYTPDYGEAKDKDGRICYAVSADGLRWSRPELGLHAYRGSRANNIVIPKAHGFPGVVFDPRDPDPGRRYKAHARTMRGHDAFFSPDGVRWGEPHRMNLDGYDRSTVHWDPTRERWIASTKSWYRTAPGAPEWRGRGYQESRDYLHWPEPARFMAGTEVDGDEIVYALEPFYYESLFFGAWGRYVQDPDAFLDVQLAVSRNARHWQRPSPEAWVPLSPLPPGFPRRKTPASPHTGVDPLDPRVPWDYGNNNVSSLGPLRVGDELWVYYSGRSSDHRSRPQTGAIGLGTLRLDGFFSLDAGAAPGTLLTRRLRLAPGGLRVNADARGGELRAEVVDIQGRPIPPFTRERCRPVTGDSVRHRVTWEGDPDPGAVLGDRPARLRFRLRRGRLFAFWTGEERTWHSPDTNTWNESR